MKRDKAKLSFHVVAALVFILLAFYIFETHDLVISCSALALGSVFIVIAGIHKWLMKNHKGMSLLFIFIEAAAMGLAAYFFSDLKNKELSIALAIVSGLYVVSVVYFLATKRHSHKHHSRSRRSKSVSSSSR